MNTTDTSAHESRFELETAEAPVVVVRWPRQPTVEAYKDFLQRFSDWCEPNGRYVVIADLRDVDATGLGEAERLAFEEGLQEQEAFWTKRLIGEVRLAPDVVVRAITSVYDDEYKLPWAVLSAGTMQAAQVHARDIRRSAGL